MSPFIKFSFISFALLFATSCNTIDFDAESHKNGQLSGKHIQRPWGIGLGTPEQPYMVEDILHKNYPSHTPSCWIIGYVVGATYQNLKNAQFSKNTTYTTNILLASDSTCTHIEECIPIELKGTKMQASFALPHNPKGFRQCVMLNGTPGEYFKKTGLRNITGGEWFYGFDISEIVPDEWQTDTIS